MAREEGDRMFTIKIAEKLNKEQTETVSNIIHDVLVDEGYSECLDFYAWDLDVDLIIEGEKNK